MRGVTGRVSGGGNLSSAERERRRAMGWLWVGAWLFFLAVQVPGLGNIDTARRLQYTRSFWTSAPPAKPEEYPEFGVHGRGGKIYPQTSVGQSLLMLPADLVAGGVEKILGKTGKEAERIRSGVVATLTFPALNALTVVVVWLWLVEMGFGGREAVAGAIGLLLGTTFLHYGQVHMENSLEDALLFADALFLWRWLREPVVKWLALAAGMVCCGILVRLTTLGEHGGVWLAVCGAMLLRKDGTAGMRFRQLLLVAPIFLAGLGMDRLIHFERFGQWTGNYSAMAVAERRPLNAALSATYPFDGDFWTGALGPLISVNRSVFIYDPLLVLLVVAAALGWKRIPGGAKLAMVGGGIGFLALDLFYARYVFWYGGTCWGNRFTLMPIHLMLPLALPLAMRAGLFNRRPWKQAALFICGFAFLAQALSLSMPEAVEDFQPRGPDRFAFVLGQRAVNLVAKISGKPGPAGIPDDLWRINIFPATLSGGAHGRAIVLWICWAALLAGGAGTLRKAVRVASIKADSP